jgi:hypothetical protein
MSTTRVRFQAAISPADGENFIQFFLESSTQQLNFTPPPPLQLEKHQVTIENYLAANPAAGDIVSDVGDALWDCLATHANVNQAFQHALEPGQPDRCISLSFTSGTAAAKELPWEALRKNEAFLSFDEGIPILREVDTTSENRPLTLLEGEKLRFLGVIAAEGEDGRGEWKALKRAFSSVSETLPIEGLILTSSPEVTQDINDNGPPNIAVGPIFDQAHALIQTIQAFGPHIAHFFCHGHAGGNLKLQCSGVEFGRKASTWLSTVDLEKALALSAWVTVLNACSLAAPPDPDAPEIAGSLNLCESLVKNGFPVVIGMRAPVNAGDAEIFAESFHTSMLNTIGTQLAKGAGPLSLAASFGGACRAILGAKPPDVSKRMPSWTLPVMNLRPDLLHLERIQNPQDPPISDAIIRFKPPWLDPTETDPSAPFDLEGSTDEGTADGGADLTHIDPIQLHIKREEAQGELAALEAILRDHSDDFLSSLGQIQSRIDSLNAQLSPRDSGS